MNMELVTKIQRVLRFIDTEAIASDALEFVKVKSETGLEGEGSLFLADLMRREGFNVTLDSVEPNRPNVYVRIEGSPSGYTSKPLSLMFNGHTDTIPVGNSRPPGRQDEWVIGRGSEDMKGGLVSMVHAAAALRKAGVQLAGDLWLTGVVGHEMPAGKKEGPRRLIQLIRKGEIQTNAIIIVEGPSAIWAASLGSTIFTITLTSDRGPIHTIKVPYSDNPVRWLGKLLVEFERLEQSFVISTSHPLCGRDQLNVGIVHAGDYFNRLPATVTVTGTRRWTPGKTCKEVRAELQAVCDQLAAESGLRFTLSLEAYREPFDTPRSHPVVRALQEAGQSVVGRPPDVIGMALVGDANLFANDGGVPTVYYGPAHETAHSDHERVSVQKLADCAKVYAVAAMMYCSVASTD
jgi:acetylornithine deacetylase/succinyl-diaminopimelate desuccinylase-like protein